MDRVANSLPVALFEQGCDFIGERGEWRRSLGCTGRFFGMAKQRRGPR
jgi:hypothetical protein